MHSTPNRSARPSHAVALFVAAALAVAGTVAAAAGTRGADALDDSVRTTADDPAPSSPYIWPSGPPADPTYFPIAVWLQSPGNAQAFTALGINLFILFAVTPDDPSRRVDA